MVQLSCSEKDQSCGLSSGYRKIEDRTGHWPSEAGMFPDNKLWEIFRVTRLIKRMLGVDPVRLLFDKSKLKRIVIFSSSEGIYPLRLLEANFSNVNRWHCPKLAGIFPLKLWLSRESSVNC